MCIRKKEWERGRDDGTPVRIDEILLYPMGFYRFSRTRLMDPQEDCLEGRTRGLGICIAFYTGTNKQMEKENGYVYR